MSKSREKCPRCGKIGGQTIHFDLGNDYKWTVWVCPYCLQEDKNLKTKLRHLIERFSLDIQPAAYCRLMDAVCEPPTKVYQID